MTPSNSAVVVLLATHFAVFAWTVVIITTGTCSLCADYWTVVIITVFSCCSLCFSLCADLDARRTALSQVGQGLDMTEVDRACG
jgi:hypothetical protein